MSGDKPDHMNIKQARPQEKRNIPYSDNEDVDMKARVSYQYPKGNFRFPLIPDQNEHKPKQRRHKSKKEEPKKVASQVVHFNKKQESFKATHVPSPIYGFKERSKTIDQPIIEYEIPSVANKANHVEQSDHQQELGDYWNKEIVATSVHTEDQEETKVEFDVHNNEEQEMYEKILQQQHDDVELEVEEKDLFQEAVDQAPKSENLNQDNPIATNTSSGDEQESERPRQHVPFNVVMLKQDRE